MRKYLRAALQVTLAGFALCASSPVIAEGTVVILRTTDASNYDPHRTPGRAGLEVVAMISDTLVSIAPDLKTIEPGLAASWSVSDDGKAYTFNLRQDVKFCDGRPMTADDVVYSMKRWVDPATNSPQRARAGEVEDVVATGPYTVKYILKTPYNILPYQLANPVAAIVDKNTVEKLGKDFGVTGFNGVGPFCWEKWAVRNELVLTKNPHYRWGPPQYENKGPAKIDKVIWRVVPEDNTRIAALQTGQGDVSYAMPFWAMPQLRTNSRIGIVKAPVSGWTAIIGAKVIRDQIKDPNVRRAMLLAIDQKELTETVWSGEADPAHTYVAPGILDHDSALEAKAVKFNKAEAERLLESAGWRRGTDGIRVKDGKRLSLVLYAQDTTLWRTVLEAVQGQLRAVGIDLQLEIMEAAAALTKMRTKDYDLFALYSGYVTAGDELETYFRSNAVPAPNRMDWVDPETDALLNKANRALKDDDRFAALAELQRRLYDATVWIPLAHEPVLVAYNKSKVKGVKPHGFTGLGLYKGLDLESMK